MNFLFNWIFMTHFLLKPENQHILHSSVLSQLKSFIRKIEIEKIYEFSIYLIFFTSANIKNSNWEKRFQRNCFYFFIFFLVVPLCIAHNTNIITYSIKLSMLSSIPKVWLELLLYMQCLMNEHFPCNENILSKKNVFSCLIPLCFICCLSVMSKLIFFFSSRKDIVLL